METLKRNITGEKFVSLEAVNNDLQTLPAGFLTDISNIQEIWLVKSNISKITPGAFKNLSYVSLSLNENKIKKIESGVFTNLTEIFSISLSKNLIDFIHGDAFTNMSNLREITLSHNRLKSWNSSWFIGTQLLYLDVSHNSIETLPNASFKFAKIHGRNIHKINLKYNRIKSLQSDTFLDLPMVNNLYFSNNKISTVNENILKYTNTSYFDLSGNQIECLPKKLENVLKARCTSLKDNPFNCSCYTTMIKWQQENGKCVYQNFNKYCASDEIQ
ncbi:hypothetical protein HHI36_007069 [Cryptolaemus montrouzieri]|uniref:Uncharacterized protein n=1 Tax=Cryptolaemus montrouzieri TaxID=559131 RepID=A0ABD2MNH6_9CUCU